jgi:DME family drug/metabolite transporter
VCLAGVVWGTIGPGVQVVHDRSSLSPVTICAYRAGAAVVTLVVAAVATGRLQACLSLARSRWRRVVAVGVLTGAFQLLFFVAVVAAGVSVTTVVALGFPPVLLLVLTSARRRRIPSLGQVVTVATAVTGLGLVSAEGTVHQMSSPVVGILAALGSGAAYALSADFAPPLSSEHDALTVTTVTVAVAGAVLVPAGLVLAALRQEPMSTDAGSWGLLVYLGVMTMAVAYVLLFAGLRTTPSGTAVVATLLEPVTAVVIAVSFLGERLTVAGGVGALLIVAAIGTLGRRPEGPPPQ